MLLFQNHKNNWEVLDFHHLFVHIKIINIKIQFYGHVSEFPPVSNKECLCLFFYAPQNVKNYEKLIKLCTHQIILNMCDDVENGENSTEMFFSE